MTEVINLNRARKARARVEASARAEHNRVVFGLAKSEKAGVRLAKAKADKALDGNKRET